MRAGPVTDLRAVIGLRSMIAAVLAFEAAAATFAKDVPQPTAAGLWERADSTGAPAAWFRILDCGGVYQGKMVKIFASPPGQNPEDWRCTACSGAKRDAPVLGLTFIDGMRRNGLAYEGGSILDPRTGLVYGARMDLSPDGRQLNVRGYLGIELLGHTETWQRIPDTAMPGRFATCSPGP
jgi:uncharacterized protein (DUF2147 family)